MVQRQYTIDPVWYTRESLRATFPFWIPEEERIVIVTELYSAYLDESGTDDGSNAVVVAGYISNTPRWDLFTQEWDSALKAWEIPAFHMTDFENYQDCFKSWSKEQHNERLNQLLQIINRYTIMSVAYIIRMRQFDDILSEEAKKICGDAYGLASIACFYQLRQLAKKIDGIIDYTMESVTQGSGALLWMYRLQSNDPKWVEDTRIHSLSFRNKRIFQPLQAADILAYEVYKKALRQFTGDNRKDRYPLKQLAIPGRCEWHYADDAELKSINEYLLYLNGRGLRR